MKKKFVCFSLMAIMMTAVVGTIVSCKDYDEDTYANLQGQLDENASVDEALQALLDNLKTVQDALAVEQGVMSAALGEQEKTISNLKDDLQNQINQLQLDDQSNTDELQQQIDDLVGQIESVDGQIGTLEAAIDLLQKADSVTNVAIDEINNALADSLAQVYVTVSGMSEEIQGYSDAFSKLAEYLPAVKENSEAIEKLQQAIEGLESCTCGDALDATYADTIANHYAKLLDVIETATYANALAEADSVRLDGAEGNIIYLLGLVENFLTAEDIADLANISDLQATQERIEAVKDSLSNVTANLTNVTDSLGGVIAGMSGILDEAKAYADYLAQNIYKYIYSTQDSIQNENIGGLQDNVISLQNFQEGAVAALAQHRSEIDDLKSRAETLEGKVDTLTTSLNDLLKLQDVLNQLVTSVLVQGTENPVFGTLSLPLNINSNVLAAYYGNLSEEAYFPTTSETYYVGSENDVFTEDDANMLGVTLDATLPVSDEGYLVQDEEGNAGTLYLTVNPNTVDFTGLTFSLENSIGEESGVKLGKLTPSDHKLTFGYTRSTDNGFYEAPATVTADVIEDVAPRIEISELKEVVSELKSYVTNGFSGLNVTDILSTLYTQFTDVLDAEAVCAAWTDAEGVSHKTYSQYSLAATAVKPLSYAFMKDANYQNFPGIGRLESFINNIFNSISIPNFDLSDYNFSEIGNITLNEDGRVTTTVTIHFDAGDLIDQTIYVKDDNGNVIGSAEVTNGAIDKDDVEVEIDITDLISDLEGNINDIIDEFNSYLSQINDILAELEQVNSISSTLDNAQSKIISYLDKLNTRLCNIVNSVNKTLQPIMLVQTDDGYVKVSGIQSAPTVISSGDINLIPTSFTGEILAPAYQKLIGVTNVYSLDLSESAQTEETTSGPGGQGGPTFTTEGAPGDNMGGGPNGDQGGQGGPGQQQQVGELTQALQTVNSSSDKLGTVVSGDTRSIEVSGLQAGYIYEFLLSAVDYSGKVTADKFYIRVAE
ncbi:MAG: hypothetical protein LUC44_05110 [Prevotellaceae bacterium]|nr:hypothetical protein [Prevotellaceae bacterium]